MLEQALGAGDHKALAYIRRFWHESKNFTTYRENILRLAAYRFFQERVAAGDKVYGASDPAKIDAVPDSELNRKAAARN
jgi:hypothetical protein